MRARKMSQYIVSFLVLLLFTLLSLQLVWAAEDDFSIADANVVVELHEEEIEISDKHTAWVRVTARVHNTRKCGDTPEYIVLPKSKFLDVKKFKATIYDATGKKVKTIGKKDGYKNCGYSENSFYTDDCQLIYNIEYDNYPNTVEYTYEREMASLFFWPDWHPQREVPVVKSTYRLTMPDNFTYKTKTTGSVPTPNIETSKGKKVITYEMTNIMPPEKEKYVYNRRSIFAGVAFSADEYHMDKYSFSGGSWEGFGRDSYMMMKDCFATNGKQDSLIANLAQDTESGLAICSKLHDAITANTRYVAIQIGIGGWRPTLSSETFERGYGDCKDLSTLYASMLREVDIDAKLALVMTKDQELTDPSFPSLGFNHMIFFMVIDGDTVWADPTCSFCEIGDIPWTDEDIYVLVLNSTGGSIVRTASSTAEQNTFIRKAFVREHNKKTIQVEYRLSATGNADHVLQSFINSSDYDLAEAFVQESDFHICKKAFLSNIVVSPKDSEIIANGIIGSAIKTIKNKKYVALDLMTLLRRREKIDLDERVYPLNLQFPMSYVDSIFIDMPETWYLEHPPEPYSYQDDFGAIDIDYKVEDNQLVISRTRSCNRYFISPEDIPAFSEHLKKIKESCQSHIAFSVR